MVLSKIIAVWAVSSTLAVVGGIPLTNVRSINGTDRENDDFGAADTPLLRLAGATNSYDDGKSTMWDNTNPRLISNTLMATSSNIENDRNLLDMVWQWG